MLNLTKLVAVSSFLLASALVGCGPGSVPDAPLRGAWHDATHDLYACIDDDGAAFEDEAGKAMLASLDTPPCTWTYGGAIDCEESGLHATWAMDGDALTITVTSACSTDPTADDFCGPYVYQRDATLVCADAPAGGQ